MNYIARCCRRTISTE